MNELHEFREEYNKDDGKDIIDRLVDAVNYVSVLENVTKKMFKYIKDYRIYLNNRVHVDNRFELEDELSELNEFVKTLNNNETKGRLSEET